MIAVRTIAVAVRTVDRLRLLLVLVRWMSCLQPVSVMLPARM